MISKRFRAHVLHSRAPTAPHLQSIYRGDEGTASTRVSRDDPKLGLTFQTDRRTAGSPAFVAMFPKLVDYRSALPAASQSFTHTQTYVPLWTPGTLVLHMQAFWMTDKHRGWWIKLGAQMPRHLSNASTHSLYNLFVWMELGRSYGHFQFSYFLSTHGNCRATEGQEVEPGESLQPGLADTAPAVRQHTPRPLGTPERTSVLTFKHLAVSSQSPRHLINNLGHTEQVTD